MENLSVFYAFYASVHVLSNWDEFVEALWRLCFNPSWAVGNAWTDPTNATHTHTQNMMFTSSNIHNETEIIYLEFGKKQMWNREYKTTTW